MKYKIIKTDLFLNGKLIPEGSSVELSKQDAEMLSQFVQVDESVENNIVDNKNAAKKKNQSK